MFICSVEKAQKKNEWDVRGFEQTRAHIERMKCAIEIFQFMAKATTIAYFIHFVHFSIVYGKCNNFKLP